MFNLLDEFKNRTQLKTAKKLYFIFVFFFFHIFSLRKNIYRLSFFLVSPSLLLLYTARTGLITFFLFLKLLATKYYKFSHSLTHILSLSLHYFALSVKSPWPVSVDTYSRKCCSTSGEYIINFSSYPNTAYII